MRAAAVTFGYLTLAGVWIYWVLDRQLFYGNPNADWLMLALVGGGHVLVGVLAARWWALLLPVLAVVLSVPAGYPSANKGEPLPIWVGLALLAPIAAVLVAIGVGGRLLAVRSS